VREHNREKADEGEFSDLKFQVTNDSRYLGRFIGDSSAQQTWMEKRTKAWAESVMEVSKIAERYPQTAYAGMHTSLQQE
jgi:hypothetical protein